MTAVTGTSLMTEAELDAAVRQLAALLAVRVYSVRNSRGAVVTSRGYPDLTLVGPGGIAWRELKTERGHAGGSWKVWRPADLTAGVIEAELRTLARTTQTSAADLAAAAQKGTT